MRTILGLFLLLILSPLRAASLDTLIIFTALSNVPPATLFATFDTFVDADTPNTVHAVLDFDHTTLK